MHNSVDLGAFLPHAFIKRWTIMLHVDSDQTAAPDTAMCCGVKMDSLTTSFTPENDLFTRVDFPGIDRNRVKQE